MKKELISRLRQLFFIFILMITAAYASAQQAVTTADPAIKTTSQFPQIFFEPATYIWILLGGILLAFIITLAHTANVLSRTLAGSHGIQLIKEESKKKPSIHRTTTWNKLMQSLTGSVPVEKEEDVMLDHNYDGIRELDNQLPPWWKWGFVITIVFACIYLLVFHVSGTGKLQLAEYNAELKNAALAKAERMKNDANYVTSSNVKRLEDNPSITEGQAIFSKNCFPCHGDKGQGNDVGPNLTDDYWLHGGGIKNIFNTITEGVAGKGMISWKSQLSPHQVQCVASFVMSLHGSNPAGAKVPQGDKWTELTTSEQETPVKSDSLNTGNGEKKPGKS